MYVFCKIFKIHFTRIGTVYHLRGDNGRLVIIFNVNTKNTNNIEKNFKIGDFFQQYMPYERTLIHINGAFGIFYNTDQLTGVAEAVI